MKEIQFPNWPEWLAQTQMPERQKQSFAITLRWYLSFCRRGSGGVTVQSARDFIEWAQAEQRPQPWQLEGWKEAIRWFFRAAKEASASGLKSPPATPPHPGPLDEPQGQQSPPHPNPPRGNGDQTADAAATCSRPAWKTDFQTTLRRRHYAHRTEETYLGWLERFARFCQTDDLGSCGAGDLKAFLDTLATERRVSASSQRQALNAVVFLLREVYGKELGDFSDYQRAKLRPHAPAWLTRAETQALLAQLEEPWALMARVALGGGLRLMDLLRLRVKDVDLEQGIITVRAGKGDKDRFAFHAPEGRGCAQPAR